MIHDNAYCGICNLFFSWKMNRNRTGIIRFSRIDARFCFLTISAGVDSEHCGSHIMFYVFYGVSQN